MFCVLLIRLANQSMRGYVKNLPYISFEFRHFLHLISSNSCLLDSSLKKCQQTSVYYCDKVRVDVQNGHSTDTNFVKYQRSFPETIRTLLHLSKFKSKFTSASKQNRQGRQFYVYSLAEIKFLKCKLVLFK